MTIPERRYTYADYKDLPEELRCEIIEGDLQMTPAPNARHQAISTFLVATVWSFVRSARLGTVLAAPTDVVLAPENVVQPDILFVSMARKDIIDPKAGINGAPDLVMEVLSPSDPRRDQVVKRDLYERYGVQEYWIVDPEDQTVEVLTRSAAGLETWQRFSSGSELTSPLLPGLTIAVEEIFAE